MNEPRRSDGILWQVSKRVFKKAKDFKPVTHDQIVDEFISIDKEDELHDYYKPKAQALPFQLTSTTCSNNPKKGSLLKSIKRVDHYAG